MFDDIEDGCIIVSMTHNLVYEDIEARALSSDASAHDLIAPAVAKQLACAIHDAANPENGVDDRVNVGVEIDFEHSQFYDDKHALGSPVNYNVVLTLEGIDDAQLLIDAAERIMRLSDGDATYYRGCAQ